MQIRKLRKGFAPAQGRLKDAHGSVVSSENRAEVLATHLEQVQWALRATVEAPHREPIHDTIEMNLASVSQNEVLRAARRLKRDRACGLDGIPSEC